MRNPRSRNLHTHLYLTLTVSSLVGPCQRSAEQAQRPREQDRVEIWLELPYEPDAYAPVAPKQASDGWGERVRCSRDHVPHHHAGMRYAVYACVWRVQIVSTHLYLYLSTKSIHFDTSAHVFVFICVHCCNRAVNRAMSSAAACLPPWPRSTLPSTSRSNSP